MSFSSFSRAPILRSRSHTGLLPITSSGSGSLSRFDSHRSISLNKRRGSAWGGALRAVLLLGLLALLGGGGYAVVRLGGRGAGGGARGGGGAGRGMRERHEPSDLGLHARQGAAADAHAHLRRDDDHLHAAHDAHWEGHAAAGEDDHLAHEQAALHDAHWEAQRDAGLGHRLEHAAHDEPGAGLHAEASQQQQQQHDAHDAAAHDDDAHQHQQQQQHGQAGGAPSLYDSGLSAVDIHGNVVHMSDLRGKATVFVNVASKCGYTDANYRGLQGVYDRYHEHGLEVLAFPCNQFGAQEPGSHEEILNFVQTTYQATLTMMAKVDVNGPTQHPVFAWLKEHAPAAPGRAQGEDIDWNFNKFLVDKWGVPVRRYASDLVYKDIEMDIYNELVRQYP